MSRGRGVLLVALCAAVAGTAAPVADGARLRLFHDTFDARYRSPFGAVPTGQRVTLRLRVTGKRATRVTLRVGRRDYRMRRSGRNLWSVTLRPSAPAVLRYAFRVRAGRTTAWYGDDAGENDDVRSGGRGMQSRTEIEGFQLTVYAAGFTTPEWLRGAVVYEIFVDRFRNGDASNDYCRGAMECPVFYGSVRASTHATWNEPVEDPRAGGTWNRDFFGGDLEGVTEKLDYLQSLGVDVIWLTPIFKARSNHRYDTDDYLAVDPGVGGDDAYSTLVAEAQRRGMRVLLDGVFNHTSSDSRYFDRYRRYAELGACESTSSPFRDWYRFRNGNTPCGSADYEGWASLDTLPALNHAAPGVRNFLLGNVVGTWHARGAAGWRLDAADVVAHEFWRELRSRWSPRLALVGEVWPDASDYLLGNEFDSVMNYRFRRALLGFLRSSDWREGGPTVEALSPREFDAALRAIREDYPAPATEAMLNLISSHDTNRPLFVLEGSRQALRLAALFQLTYVGAPMVYYGDEAAIDARPPSGSASEADPYNRAPYPWADASGNPDVYGPADETTLHWYSLLGQLRRELPALRSGAFETLHAGATTYAFARAGGAAKPVIVVLNKGAAPASARVRVARHYAGDTTLVDRLTGTEHRVAAGILTVTVPARGGLVLVGR